MRINQEIAERLFKNSINTALKTELFEPKVVGIVERETRITVVPFEEMKHYGEHTSSDGKGIEICDSTPAKFKDYHMIYHQSIIDHGFGHAYDLIKNPSFRVRFTPESKELKPYFEKIDWCKLGSLPRHIRRRAREILDLEKKCRERRAVYTQYLLARFRENSGEWPSSLKGIGYSPSDFILKKARARGYDISPYLIDGIDLKGLGTLIIYV